MGCSLQHSLYKSLLGATRYPLHERGRRDDRDLAERIEREQIAIAGHDQVRAAVDCQLEEFVVRGIAARGDPLGDRDQLGGYQHLPQPDTRVGMNQRVKVRAGQDLETPDLDNRNRQLGVLRLTDATIAQSFYAGPR